MFRSGMDVYVYYIFYSFGPPLIEVIFKMFLKRIWAKRILFYCLSILSFIGYIHKALIRI